MTAFLHTIVDRTPTWVWNSTTTTRSFHPVALAGRRSAGLCGHDTHAQTGCRSSAHTIGFGPYASSGRVMGAMSSRTIASSRAAYRRLVPKAGSLSPAERESRLPVGVGHAARLPAMTDETDLHAGDGRAEPILSFVSHIEGKNARVHVWPDRVEWDRKGLLGAGAKAGMAVMTLGASYLATGVGRKQSTEVIPVKSITSVTTKKGMGLQTKLSVITAGNTIEMRVAHKEAEQVKSVLLQLVAGSHPTQRVAPPAPSAPAPAAAPDVSAQLVQLAGLRDAGILTDEEFVAKKAELIARL